MNRFQMRSVKYDGSRNYDLAISLIAREDGLLICHMPLGTPFVHYRRNLRFEMNYQAIGFIWLERWYGIWADARADGSLIMYYGNIQLPARLAGDTLTIVDLDLDVKVQPDLSHYVDDVDEFEAHVAAMNIPPDVQQGAWEAVEAVTKRVVDRLRPFDGAWRRYLPAD